MADGSTEGAVRFGFEMSIGELAAELDAATVARLTAEAGGNAAKLHRYLCRERARRQAQRAVAEFKPDPYAEPAKPTRKRRDAFSDNPGFWDEKGGAGDHPDAV